MSPMASNCTTSEQGAIIIMMQYSRCSSPCIETGSKIRGNKLLYVSPGGCKLLGLLEPGSANPRLVT